jgi:NAD(P)-dependent dehydrogenase (short-subunit alcohol dehydrogenase family)
VLLADFGRVDVLCNNAGIYPGMNPVWAIDIRAWRNLFEIKLLGRRFRDTGIRAALHQAGLGPRGQYRLDVRAFDRARFSGLKPVACT